VIGEEEDEEEDDFDGEVESSLSDRTCRICKKSFLKPSQLARVSRQKMVAVQMVRRNFGEAKFCRMIIPRSENSPNLGFVVRGACPSPG